MFIEILNFNCLKFYFSKGVYSFTLSTVHTYIYIYIYIYIYMYIYVLYIYCIYSIQDGDTDVNLLFVLFVCLYLVVVLLFCVIVKLYCLFFYYSVI